MITALWSANLFPVITCTIHRWSVWWRHETRDDGTNMVICCGDAADLCSFIIEIWKSYKVVERRRSKERMLFISIGGWRWSLFISVYDFQLFSLFNWFSRSIFINAAQPYLLQLQQYRWSFWFMKEEAIYEILFIFFIFISWTVLFLKYR